MPRLGLGATPPPPPEGVATGRPCSQMKAPFCNCTGGAGNTRTCSCAGHCGKCGGCDLKTCQICDEATCNMAIFQRKLGDVQCEHLKRAQLVNGKAVTTSAECCAACTTMGPGCETWQFCAAGQGCATGVGVPKIGGCYIGKMVGSSCKNSTSGWLSYARTAPAPPAPAPAPSPAPPPADPKLYKVTDVWKQAELPGNFSRLFVGELASRDSVFITISPLSRN